MADAFRIRIRVNFGSLYHSDPHLGKVLDQDRIRIKTNAELKTQVPDHLLVDME
jgi:hypothetical protein